MEPSPVLVNLNYYSPTYWLPLFKPITLKTRLIETNLKFFQYLSADGIFIHSKYRKAHARDSLDLDQIEESDPQTLSSSKNPTFEAFSNKNNEDFSSNQENLPEELVLFPEFDQQILNVLEEFDNKVFVKLNWKAPRDIESWVPKLMCQNIEDILMALKSSTIIGEMLEELFPRVENLKEEKDLKNAGGLVLVVKKWYDLNKALEFRCFVRNSNLIAVSQRNNKMCFGFLKEKEFQIKLVEKIEEFFKGNIKGKFVDCDFVFDIYVEIKEKIFKVWLLDLSPWGNLTNPLLFSWEELEKSDKNFEFKIINDDNTMVLEKNTGLCQMPVEFKGEVNEQNVKKWLESLNEDKNAIE